MDLCMTFGQFQTSIWRILDCKTTQIYMVVGKHRIQTFEVVVGVLLLFLLSLDVFVPTSAHPLLFLDKWIVQIYLDVFDMKILPYYLLHLTTIPSTIIEGKFIPLDSNDPQHHASKEEPH
jgi:hypothetical protein